MRIEIETDLRGPIRRAHRQKPSATGTESPRISRRERALRRIALGMHIEELVQSGQVESYAEVAKLCLVSRARVSQIVSYSRSLQQL